MSPTVPADSLDIRPFEPDDLAVLQQIREAAFRSVFQSFRDLVGPEIGSIAFDRSDAAQARLLDEICRDDSGHDVLVATLGRAIVGFVSFSVDRDKRLGEIGLNAVHPDHAGKGIGTRLFGQVLDRMKALGILVAEVSTGSDPSHAAARRAYEKVGFGPSIPSVTFYKRL